MHDVLFATAVLFVAAIGVLVVALFARTALFDKARTAHWKHNDAEVRLRRKRHGNYDVFVSQYASCISNQCHKCTRDAEPLTSS